MATQCPTSFKKRRPGVTWLNTNTPPDKDALDRADSGYGSSKSTLDGKSSEVEKSELEHRVSRQLFSRLRKKKLKLFDQEISQAVQDRFSDLTELFGPSLYSFLLDKGVKYNAISIKLKVLGEDERSAKPWVVIQCDEAASKSIRNFFDQKEVKGQYRPGNSEPNLPSFDVVIHPRAPVPLSTSRPVSVYVNSCPDVETLCGKIIKISNHNEPHIATLGGVVEVEISLGRFMLLGLTAGHSLTKETVIENGHEPESPPTYIYTTHSSCETEPTHVKSENQEVEDSILYYVGDSQEQEDEDSVVGYELDVEFEIEQVVDVDKATEGTTSFQDSSLDITTEGCQEQFWSRIGTIFSTSSDVLPRAESDQKSEPDQDWALIRIRRGLHLPNLLAGQPDVELAELSGELDKSEGSREVVLASDIGGIKHGTLSFSPSFLMLGQAKSFTKTYNLLLHDASVPTIGESGSWVLDDQNHGVYGHLVASDVLREAYVVPFDKIVLDIKNRIGAVSVHLPSHNDIFCRDYVQHIPDSGYSSANRLNDFVLTSGERPSGERPSASLSCSDVDTDFSDPVPNDPVPNDPTPKKRLKSLIKSIFAGTIHRVRR